MTVRLALVFVIAFGVAAFEARAGHHEEAGSPVEKGWKGKPDPEWKKARDEGRAWKKEQKQEWKKRKRAAQGDDSDSASSASVSESSDSRADDDSASQASDSASRADARGRGAGKDRSNAARERLSPDERAALQETEGPGFWGRMRRFFGFERSAERRADGAADPVRARGHGGDAEGR